jgi:hypothetical protein
MFRGDKCSSPRLARLFSRWPLLVGAFYFGLRNGDYSSREVRQPFSDGFGSGRLPELPCVVARR